MLGHSTLAGAQSSHIAPVMLLSSIVTATGVVVFFLYNVLLSMTVKMLKACMQCTYCKSRKSRRPNYASKWFCFYGFSASSPYEYYDGDEDENEDEEGHDVHFHGEFVIEESSTHTMDHFKKEEDTKNSVCMHPLGKGGDPKHMKKPSQSTSTKSAVDDGNGKFHGKFHANGDESGDESESEDMDQYAYESSGLVDYMSNPGGGGGGSSLSALSSTERGALKKVLTGDILTMTMVWTNVYGLGIAVFLLMPIITMASTLAAYNFIVGLNAVTVFEMIQERNDPQYKFRQWRAGRLGASIRNALHVSAVLLVNVVVVLMGLHVASIEINKIGQIKVEDVFFGIVGPLLTPVLLKRVRRPHTTIMGTMELAMPFSAFLALTFMISVLAMGMKPYEVREQLSRNMVASTIILPTFFGGVVMYILHCVLRRRMLYVLCTFLVVFVGRQFTFSRQQYMVSASLVLSIICFFIVMITSSKKVMKWISRRN